MPHRLEFRKENMSHCLCCSDHEECELREYFKRHCWDFPPEDREEEGVGIGMQVFCEIWGYLEE